MSESPASLIIDNEVESYCPCHRIKQGQDKQESRDINNSRKCHCSLLLFLWNKLKQRIRRYGPDYVSTFIIVALTLLMLFFIFGGTTTQNKDENDDPWIILRNVSILWLSSLTCGFLVQLIGLPPLLGMLISGILLTNASTSTSLNLPEKGSEFIRASGLATILLRSGLELDLKSIQKSHTSASTIIKLTCLPGLIEALACGLSSMLIFDMPPFLGLSLGFILAAVSPAVVVVGMLKLQNLGYGVAKGIPSLVLAAASFDDVVAIIGFTVCIGIALPNNDNSSSDDTSWIFSILNGILSIILGVAIGFIFGLLLSLTKLWCKQWKRSFVSILLVINTICGMKATPFSGSGAIGTIGIGVVASTCWARGYPKMFALSSNPSLVHETRNDISILWKVIFEPLLFGVIGSALQFHKIPSGTVSKSLLVITFGLIFRLPTAYCAVSGKGLTRRECAFVSLAWLPKATVQAALCSFPSSLIKNNMSSSSNYDKYVIWGDQILSTAILSIIVTAPLGLICIQQLGPKWLKMNALEEGKVKERSKENQDVGQRTEQQVITTEIREDGKHQVLECVSQLDDLLQNLGMFSNNVECSCLVAEARQVVWKSKSLLQKMS